MAEDREEQIVIPDDKARQGEIVLRKRWERFVFIAGLAGIIVVVVVARFVGHH